MTMEDLKQENVSKDHIDIEGGYSDEEISEAERGVTNEQKKAIFSEMRAANVGPVNEEAAERARKKQLQQEQAREQADQLKQEIVAMFDQSSWQKQIDMPKEKGEWLAPEMQQPAERPRTVPENVSFVETDKNGVEARYDSGGHRTEAIPEDVPLRLKQKFKMLAEKEGVGKGNKHRFRDLFFSTFKR